jgi:hypothetical protein
LLVLEWLLMASHGISLALKHVQPLEFLQVPCYTR